MDAGPAAEQFILSGFLPALCQESVKAPCGDDEFFVKQDSIEMF
jgi:hypothetical protein